MSNVTLAEMLHRWDKLSTCFHHSLDPTGAFASVLLFLLINSLIFLLTSASRSLLLGAILDFILINDFTKGVIHTGSRDEVLRFARQETITRTKAKQRSNEEMIREGAREQGIENFRIG